jgi:hypothetical protein
MTAGESNQPSVKIFIGAPVEHRSEFDFLMQVHTALSNCSGCAIIFANFQVGRRQIDLAVFTDKATIVIEAKHYAKPVSGGMSKCSSIRSRSARRSTHYSRR